MLPKSIKVGPYNYKVGEVVGLISEENDEVLGYCRPYEQIINIEKNSTSERKKVVIIHELLHAMFEVINTDLAGDKEEQLITVLSPVFYSLLRDNPKLVNYIME